MTTAIEYALMAGHAYRTTRDEINWIPAPLGWTPFFPVPDSTTSTFITTNGFEAVSFIKGNDIVISYAGTDSTDYLGDILADIGLGLGNGSSQFLQAAEYYLQVKAANPTANITFTGHSLGGGLAALMGVFFNKTAFTFDQAPFRNAAENDTLASSLFLKLSVEFPESSYPQIAEWLLPLQGFIHESFGVVAREGNVTNVNVQGEFLSVPPASLFDRIGVETTIPNSAIGVSIIDLHSQALLTAFLQSIQSSAPQQTLNVVTFKLTDLIRMIFDKSLFAYSTDKSNDKDVNFLEHLVRHEAGVEGLFAADGMVTRFTADLWKIAQDGGLTLTNSDIRKTLIAFAMQKYYDEQQTSAGYGKELFTQESGYIHFDRSDVADTLTAAKGYTQYFMAYLNSLPGTERQAIINNLPNLMDWYIQAGSDAMSATAGDQRAFMLGGDGDDSLTGSSLADVLVGNAGADTLNGGSGDDILIGGAGNDTLNGGNGYDTYLINGHDTIYDADGFGVIKDKSGNIIGGAIEHRGDGSYVFTTNPGISVVKDTNLTLTLVDGSSVVINNFQNGQFGLHLIETGLQTPPDTTRTIVGDYEWKDFDPDTDGIQKDYDSLGNPIQDFGKPKVMDDYLSGSAGSDLILPGSGNDMVYAKAGDDKVVAGAGRDIVSGGSGNDILYGDNEVSVEQAILNGNTDIATGLQGDWLAGNAGDDILIGGAGNDVLTGGGGQDLLIGGAGDDDIMGDSDWVAQSHDWTVTDTSQSRFFQPVTGAGIAADGAADVIYAGSGNDHVWGGLGDDVIYGEGGNDILSGNDGNDIIMGGDGDDIIHGDGVAIYGQTNVDEGDDFLDGGAGNDTLIGGGGADTLLGGDGMDLLYGDGDGTSGNTQGNDYLDGGDGNDELYGGGGDDFLIGGDGMDTLFGDSAETPDEMHGNDYLDGGEGDDILVGGGGSDTLYGGKGNDILSGDGDNVSANIHGNDFLDGGDGDDILIGGGGSDVLIGGDGADQLYGESANIPAVYQGDDFLDGGAGDDILNGGGGNDTLLGGDGNDQLYGDADITPAGASGDDYLDGGAGDDILVGAGGSDTLYGGDGNDVMDGDAAGLADSLHGNDYLDGGAGDDSLIGGGGADRLFGGDGNDVLQGDGVGISAAVNGDDYLDGGAGNDTLYGDGGNDYLVGGTGNDWLEGGAGDDSYLVQAGDGQDRISDVEGSQTLVFSSGISATDIRFGSASNFTTIEYSDTDYLYLDDESFSAIQSFKFSNGSSLSADEIMELSGSYVGHLGTTLADSQLRDSSYFIYSDINVLDNFRTTINDTGGFDAISFQYQTNIFTDQSAMGLMLQGSYVDGNDLVMSVTLQSYLSGISDKTGEIRIANHFSNYEKGSGGVEKVQFSNISLVDSEYAVSEMNIGTTQKLFAQNYQTTMGGFLAEVTSSANISYIDKLVHVGTNADDVINTPSYVAEQNDYYGYGGNDTMIGSNKRDTFFGGAGNDTMKGGLDYDTYHIDPNDYDVVFDDGRGESGVSNDALYVPAGIALSQLVFVREGNDLLIGMARIQKFFEYDSNYQGDKAYPYTIERLYGDGWVVNNLPEYLKELGVYNTLLGTDGNDALEGDKFSNHIYGGAGDDRIYGMTRTQDGSVLDGDDVLYGGAGWDVLVGGNGNDTLLGGDDSDLLIGDFEAPFDSYLTTQSGRHGRDILDGGAGDDTLWGGQDGDTYKINIGGGFDQISDVYASRYQAELASVNSNLTTLSNSSSSTYSSSSWSSFGSNLAMAGLPEDIRADLIALGSVVPKAQAVDTLSRFRDWMITDQNDVVEFGAGITPENIRVEWNAGVFVIGEGEDRGVLAVDIGAGEGFVIYDYDGGTNFGIERFRFADGTEYSLSQFLALDTTAGLIGGQLGSVTDDTLIGSFYEDIISGDAGDDVIDSGAGYDYLMGGDGADILIGGRAGDDLDGDAGSDVYVINIADAGGDSIYDSSGIYSLTGDVDTLSLGGVIQPDAILASLKVSDNFDGTDSNLLFLRIPGADGVLSIYWDSPHYDGSGPIENGSSIERIQFLGSGNDRVFDLSALVAAHWDALRTANDLGTEIALFTSADLTNFDITNSAGFAGGDVALEYAQKGYVTHLKTIKGTSGADTLIGTSANERLIGLGGNDTLDGGAGADVMVGGLGNDTYIVDNVADVVTEKASEGTDTVKSSVDYTLAANVENLTLTGTAAINGTGNSQNNTLTGNSAANILNGGAGVDTLVGGAGNDTYVVDSTGDIVTENANAGIDTVQSSVTYTLATNVENLTLTGTVAINGTGNTLNNIMIGNSAANTLNGGAGSDTMSGGIGNDTYVVDSVSDVVFENLNEGTDLVQSSVTYTLSSNIENLTLTGTTAINGTGNELDNTLAGNSAVNILSGGAGNDMLNGGAGADKMSGGTGNDTYVVDNVSDVVTENTNEGTDLVQSSVTYTIGNNVENLTLTGTTAINGTGNTLDNVLIGNSAINTLTGGAGNDTLDGGAGADKLTGGAGNDLYIVDNVSDVITEIANEGIDSVQSSVTFTLAANVENLTLTGTVAINGTGNTLNNILMGNSANNTLSGGTGADTMSGGAGNDTYVVDNISDVVIEYISEGTDLVQSSVTYSLGANVENLTLTGTTAINGTGNDLDNTLTGNSAVNILNGGAGNDTLNGGTGADKLNGGTGNDLYIVDNTGDVVTENANEGIDTVQSSITYLLGNNVENLTLTGTTAINGTGNALDNVLIGNSAINTLTGGAGNDTLDGGAGADKLIGGAGDDTYIVDNASDVITENVNEGTDLAKSSVTYTLVANVENLILTGTSAINGTGNTLNNVLVGNSAANTLTGGAGNDILDGAAANDSLVGGTGNDSYLFGRGYGVDTVTENDATAGNTDLALFGTGIAANQMWFQHIGNNLDVGIIGTSDHLVIKDWYLGSQYRVEQFKTADGKQLLDTQVESLVSAMAAFAPPAAGQTSLSPEYEAALTPVIAANWQ